MSDRLHAVNQDLQILGDAYRLGQIQRDEYRARRRHVLAALRSGGDADTTRKSLPMAQSGPRRTAPLPTTAAATKPAAPPVARKYWLLFGIGVLGLAAVLAWLLKAPEDAPPSAVAPVAARTPLADLEAAASELTARDDWQAATVQAWLIRWQQAEPALRRQALSRPALQHLRDQAAYNLSVRKALATPDSEGDPDGNGTESLERLLRALESAS
ncbi:hypothetical protein [Nevskia sp.]|uniref:hypothetical protein n=1 Tax=Nevskia sp. TaxID=1929292 RepID=UPI0025ED3492|nr:hypothetical protein [Nevskia sp.]